MANNVELTQQHIDNVASFREAGGFFKFCQVFYPILVGRQYSIPRPNSRRPHVFEMCEQLEYTFHNPTENLGIFIPPGHLKTTHLVLFVAWTMSIYPDCNYMYTSYSSRSSASNTASILALMQSREYQDLFMVRIDPKRRARDDFFTLAVPGVHGAGRVYAAGFQGTITGVNAGIPFEKRYTGALLIDDIYNVGEANSPTIVEKTKYQYTQVLTPRIRSATVPTICICQNTGDQSLIWHFIEQKDLRPWRIVKMPAMDVVGNALAPEIRNEKELAKMALDEPYLFKTQYQQEKVPLGDPLFCEQDFVITDSDPDIIATFITVDCAETDKTYNDATAMTFFGIYKIKEAGHETGLYGIHIINCWEERIMPALLVPRLKEFYMQSAMFKVKPKTIYIEKKSTGVMTLDIMQEMRGVEVLGIDHNVSSGSKADRFIAMQKYVKQKLISLPWSGRHSRQVIEHMLSINPAMTHKHDDICDTLEMACDVVYKSGIALADLESETRYDHIASDMVHRQSVINEIRGYYPDDIGFYNEQAN